MTPRGRQPDVDNYSSLIRKALDHAGLRDATVHTLRRTVERNLERAGATVAERETFMGHTEQVARRYYADHGEMRSEVLERIENVE